tara:strand:+ start:234068 stop:234508 length:441 start_codon:yes stop_codon:yes gene_type:complete
MGLMIWFKEPNLKKINDWCKNTAVDHNGIEIVEAADNSLTGTMPVDHRTVQPQRRLHGGVSCVLSESLASIAANMVLDQSKYVAFGISIEANHLRPAIEGSEVKGITKPIHLGKTIQVWDTNIYDDRDRLVCSSKLTLAVVKTRSE